MTKETRDSSGKEDRNTREHLNGGGVTVAEVLRKKGHQQMIIGTIALTLLIIIVAGYVANSFLLLCIAIGSIGGILHDLIQNKGLVVYPVSTAEGIYIGLGLGTLLGAASGFIAYSTIATPSTIDAKSLVIPLTWGLGLKGLVDGATNKITPNFIAEP